MKLHNKEKQRGQQRKLYTLLNNINSFIPFQRTDEIYEHFHVPSSQFISSPKTSSKIKTAFCKKWLEKTENIIKQKPNNLPFCKVVALINASDLWESQIIIFYSKDYYNEFWNRHDSYQKWELIKDKNLSFIKPRNIKTVLSEKGYYCTITENDLCEKSTLWFYGELK